MARLEIIIGPMYCSKTTEVIRRLATYVEMDLKVLYINTKLDTRTSSNFSTHNKIIGELPFDSVKVDTLQECPVEKYDVLAIDEAQFFPNLFETVLDWVETRNKTVIVAGLNGDFKRQKFGQILELIPFADDVVKLSAFCMSCKKQKNKITPAHFSKRIIKNDTNVLIGGKETYIPVCRTCYNFFN